MACPRSPSRSRDALSVFGCAVFARPRMASSSFDLSFGSSNVTKFVVWTRNAYGETR